MRTLLAVLAAAALTLLALAPAASAAPAISSCYAIEENNSSFTGYLNDPGVHNPVLTVSPGNVPCFTFNATGGFVDGYSVYRLPINGGADCLKMVYPSTGTIYDEGCDNTSNEWFIRVLTTQGYYFLDPVYQDSIYADITTAALGNRQKVYSGTSNCSVCGEWHLVLVN